MKYTFIIYLIFSLYLISCHKNKLGNRVEIEYSNEEIKQKIKIGDSLETVIRILGKPTNITTQQVLNKFRLETGKTVGIMGGDFMYNYKYKDKVTGIIFKNDIVKYISN